MQLGDCCDTRCNCCCCCCWTSGQRFGEYLAMPWRTITWIEPSIQSSWASVFWINWIVHHHPRLPIDKLHFAAATASAALRKGWRWIYCCRLAVWCCREDSKQRSPLNETFIVNYWVVYYYIDTPTNECTVLRCTFCCFPPPRAGI